MVLENELGRLYKQIKLTQSKKLLAVYIDINDNHLTQKTKNFDLEILDKLLSARQDKHLFKIDREIVEFIQVQNFFKSSPESEAFFISLKVQENLSINSWLFDPDLKKFCVLVNKLIQEHYQVFPVT